MSDITPSDLFVFRVSQSMVATPLTPAEFDALARAWAVENGWVERTEARRWVDGMAEVADRYKRERDIARYHQETTERSYKQQIEYMRENGWVEPKACGECEGKGKEGECECVSHGDFTDCKAFAPCPSCEGKGFKASGDGPAVTRRECPSCGGTGRERIDAIDVAHLERQREFSERTFGPGRRTAGVIDHIRKELAEIEADPLDLGEWVDVIILAFDGAWRAGWEPADIIAAVKAKQERNEQREWPDWRTASEDQAIEHLRDAALEGETDD